MHRLGSAVQYSTESSEKGHGARKGSEAISYRYSDSSKTFGGLLPGKATYGGLGRLLVESPLETLHSEFEARELMRLHTDFVTSQSNVICAIECNLTRSGQTVTEYGIDTTAVCNFLLLLSVRLVNALLGWGRAQGRNSPGVSVALKRRI